MNHPSRIYAGFWTRVLAFAYDYLIIALYLAVLVGTGIIINSAFPNTAALLFGNPISGQISGFLTVTLPVTLYFALSEASHWQATWGKRKRRLKVIRTDGEPLSIPHAMGRNLLKFVPWELAHTCIWQISFSPQDPSPLITVGFVLVWVLVGANALSLITTKTHQSLYDRLAGTYVIVERT